MLGQRSTTPHSSPALPAFPERTKGHDREKEACALSRRDTRCYGSSALTGTRGGRLALSCVALAALASHEKGSDFRAVRDTHSIHQVVN